MHGGNNKLGDKMTTFHSLSLQSMYVTTAKRPTIHKQQIELHLWFVLTPIEVYFLLKQEVDIQGSKK